MPLRPPVKRIWGSSQGVSHKPKPTYKTMQQNWTNKTKFRSSSLPNNFQLVSSTINTIACQRILDPLSQSTVYQYQGALQWMPCPRLLLQRAPGKPPPSEARRNRWDGEPLYHWSSLRSWTRQTPYWAPKVLRREIQELSQVLPKGWENWPGTLWWPLFSLEKTFICRVQPPK